MSFRLIPTTFWKVSLLADPNNYKSVFEGLDLVLGLRFGFRFRSKSDVCVCACMCVGRVNQHLMCLLICLINSVIETQRKKWE